MEGTEYDIWRGRNPDLCRTMKAPQLGVQRRAIINGKSLTKEMRTTIETTVDDVINRRTAENGTDTNIEHHQTPIPSAHPTDAPPVIPESPNEDDDTSYFTDELRVAYHIWKDRPHTEREKLKTFALSKVNRAKLADMNVAIEELQRTEDIVGMPELNTLSYTAARLLAGVCKPHDPQDVPKQRDPDHDLMMKIKRTRQWIGRLTAVIQSGKITMKVKALLKGKSTQTVLTTYKMRLASQCKKLRTKVARRRRFHNNKLHRYKVKALYQQLRYGETKSVNPPPPKMR